MSATDPQRVADRLAGANLLLTGASGFLGKAVLATWLREIPGTGTITLLLRAAPGSRSRCWPAPRRGSP